MLLGAIFVVLHGLGALVGWLERRRDARVASGIRVTWREVFSRFVMRLTQAFKWLLVLALVYAWAAYVLERFPLTQPIGHKLGRFIVDTVVWNPGAGKAAELKDLDDGGWRRMLCIEAAAIGTPIQLAPGQSWHGSQTLEAR